jgi:hypothetical protein
MQFWQNVIYATAVISYVHCAKYLRVIAMLLSVFLSFFIHATYDTSDFVNNMKVDKYLSPEWHWSLSHLINMHDVLQRAVVVN